MRYGNFRSLNNNGLFKKNKQMLNNRLDLVFLM